MSSLALRPLLSAAIAGSTASRRCVTVPSGPAGVRRVRISLPLIEPLLDNSKYFLESDLGPLAGQDLRSLCRPKVEKVLGKPDKPPRRGALWTSYDNRTLIKRRLG